MTDRPSDRSSERPGPTFTGVIIHRDPRGRFAVRHATGWRTFEIRSDAPVTEPLVAEVAGEIATGVAGEGAAGEGGAAAPDAGGAAAGGEAAPVAQREGIGFSPPDGDPATVFTAWAAPLGEHVVAEDLEDLKAGVDEGLAALDGCRIESASDAVYGNLIRFERIYTFRGEGGAVRKRKQWLLYVDRWLICLTWQGANEEEYEHWFAMANQSFLTFEIPQALWFSTDRELR